jgi:hypothetical protein
MQEVLREMISGGFLVFQTSSGNSAYNAAYLCCFCRTGGDHDCAATPRDLPRRACKISEALRLLDRDRGRAVVSLTRHVALGDVMMALSVVPQNGAEIDELISDKRASWQPMLVGAERTSFGAVPAASPPLTFCPREVFVLARRSFRVHIVPIAAWYVGSYR